MTNTLARINPFLARRRGRAHSAQPRHEAETRPQRRWRSLRWAKLPMAPVNASPVPGLTSLYHFDEAGSYGDRSYPGNCGGNLIRDLLRYFQPRSVFDPMTGSGTCRDVCRELGVACVSGDIHAGFDAADPQHVRRVLDQHAGGFDFVWLHQDGLQRTLWPGVLELSPDFFNTLLEHAVPLDHRALAALKHSSLALDIYTWLAHRLCRVNRASGVKLSWANLKDQFGPDYTASKDFKKEFRQAMRQVCAVYPDARVEEAIGGLVLFPSRAPMARIQISVPRVGSLFQSVDK